MNSRVLRHLYVILLLLCCTTLILGCDGSIVEATLPSTSTIGNATEPVEIETAVSEMLGDYTLDECKSSWGVYIAHEDGSFTRYPAGGYCEGLDAYESCCNGMFLVNNIVESIPDYVNKSDKLVVFSDAEFSLDLIPVNFQVGAIQLSAEDGTEGYGLITSQNENATWMNAYYKNHEYDSVKILFVDGVPSQEYQFEMTEQEVTPYKGMPNEIEYVISYGFTPDSAVRLGVAEGTTLVETTYEVSATYYDCAIDHRDWQKEDVYYIICTPTSDGYATIDMIDVVAEETIPTGVDVMLLRSGGRYIATLLNWENN